MFVQLRACAWGCVVREEKHVALRRNSDEVLGCEDRKLVVITGVTLKLT